MLLFYFVSLLIPTGYNSDAKAFVQASFVPRLEHFIQRVGREASVLRDHRREAIWPNLLVARRQFDPERLQITHSSELRGLAL